MRLGTTHSRSSVGIPIPQSSIGLAGGFQIQVWYSALVIDLLKSHLGKAIGNGQTTNLWKDSWISLTENLKPVGPVTEEALDLKVSDLLTTDMEWNKEKIEKLIPQLAKQIQCIRPSQKGAEDIYVWQPLPSGVYSTKSGYFSASKESSASAPPNPLDFDWNKDVWMGTFSTKMKLFLWSAIRKALPLGENLNRRGIQSNIECKRC